VVGGGDTSEVLVLAVAGTIGLWAGAGAAVWTVLLVWRCRREARVLGSVRSVQ